MGGGLFLLTQLASEASAAEQRAAQLKERTIELTVRRLEQDQQLLRSKEELHLKQLRMQ